MSLLCLWSAGKKVEEQLGKKAKKMSRKKSGKKSRKKSREEKSSTQFAWHLPGSVQTLRRVLRGVFTWEKSHRREFHTGMTFWFRITFTCWLGHFEGTLHVYNRKHHACATRSSLPADRFHPGKGWTFRVYMISSQNLVPEWNSRLGAATGVNSRRGDSRRHDILWWYHVHKCRAIGGNRSEPASARKSPRCYVNTPTGFRS